MPVEKITTECVVIGGGPAGSQSARRLAEAGRDVILIERNLYHDKPCGGGIPSIAFEDFNIPLSLIKKKVEWIKLVSPLGDEVRIKLEGGTICIVERKEFDFSLREIASMKGARLLQGNFRGFNEISNKRIVSRIIIDKGPIEILSKYAIIAGGINSGLTIDEKLKKSFTLTIKGIPIEDIERGPDTCEFYLGSSHAERFYSWVFPSSDKNISVGTGAFEVLKVRDMLNRFLLRRGIRIDGKVRGYWIPLWHSSKRLLNPWKNIIVTGDAGGIVMPLSFEGIYYALSSGNLASEAILTGKPGEYVEKWNRQYYRRFKVMKLLWNYFLKDDRRAEDMVKLHKRREIQEASMRLWLRKDKSHESLLIYIKLFKHAVGKYVGEILSRQ